MCSHCGYDRKPEEERGELMLWLAKLKGPDSYVLVAADSNGEAIDKVLREHPEQANKGGVKFTPLRQELVEIDLTTAQTLV